VEEQRRAATRQVAAASGEVAPRVARPRVEAAAWLVPLWVAGWAQAAAWAVALTVAAGRLQAAVIAKKLENK